MTARGPLALTIIVRIVSPLLFPIAAYDRWMRICVSRLRLRWALRRDRKAAGR